MAGELIAIVLGAGVGLSLGALGGGGSTLAVPILVFVAGLSARDATTASLLVVGIAAAIGAFGHARHGTVRMGTGLAFGAAGIAGSTIGTAVNRSIDQDLLLLGFAGLVLLVAAKMFRSANAADRSCAEAGAALTTAVDSARSPAEPPAGAGASAVATAPARHRLDLDLGGVARLAVAATGVGLLTGLFGVGGGFAVVPALVLLLGFSTREAIGTSLVVIAMNSVIALGMRLGDLHLDWAFEIPFLATVTVGVVAGSRLAARIDADRLTRAFATLLAVVAVYTAGGALLG